MAVQTEGAYLNDWLKWEQENHYSREKVTIASGNTIVKGQVLGIVTASGNYAAHDQDATDGTEAAAGIAIDDYDASTADVEGVAIVRDALVVEANLTFQPDIDAAEQVTAMAELKALGIVTRTEV
jgi:hypothetical protein